MHADLIPTVQRLNYDHTIISDLTQLRYLVQYKQLIADCCLIAVCVTAIYLSVVHVLYYVRTAYLL